MNPLGNRARAQELARLLEGAVAGPGTATAGYAALAMRLRAVSGAIEVAPAPDFRDALRQRLLAVAAVQGIGRAATAEQPATEAGLVARAVSWTRSWKAQRRMALTAGAMAAVVAVSGVALASSRSLPGQPFYGMKRVAESVQLSLAGSDTERGTLHLEFAATRLREVRALAEGEGQLALAGTGDVAGGTAWGGSVSSRIRSTLDDFNTETEKGRTLLEEVYRETGRKEPLRVLTTFARQQQSRLTAILPELPIEAAEAAEDSLELVTEVGTSANELLGFQACDGIMCSPNTPEPTPTSEPTPLPGASASPTETPAEDGGEPSATPTPTPEPTPGPSSEPTPEPTAEPTAEPTPTTTPSPTSSPTQEPGLLPDPVVSLLPEPIQSLLPTAIPTLPAPLPTLDTTALAGDDALPLP